MGALDKYIESVKEKTKGFTEIEKLRYVYLDLGKRFSFNLNFSFGNTKTKKDIYMNSRNKEEFDEIMNNNNIICKSSSYIYEYVMKELGIDLKTEVYSEDNYTKFPHMYNVLTKSDNKKYTFDLQLDIRNIRAHLRTGNFGIAMEENEMPLINRFELEQLDKKLGYITDELYYADDYLELIKINMAMIDDFSKKVQFVLENLEDYTDPKMEYAERKWRMEDLIGIDNQEGLLFSSREKNKIHLIDCYKEKDGKKDYQMCIVVDTKNGNDIYLFSKENNSFEKKSLKQLAELVENGLVNLQGIQGLKQVLNQRKQSDAER